MAWCRFFIPKIASTGIKPEDPKLNEHIAYAKCVKGHVLKDANDWVLCENLPASDATCWQEGGDTLFSLARCTRNETTIASNGTSRPAPQQAATARKGRS